MYCQQCGAPVQPQHKFCPACGHKIALPEGHVHSKGHSFFWLKAILGSIAFLFAAFIAIALVSEDITDVVVDQLNAIQSGKITEAYYNYTSKEFQAATSLPHFREFVEKYPDFSLSKSVRFVDRSVNGDHGVLQAKLLSVQGMEMPVQYTLEKDGSDKWKIVNIKFEANPSSSSTEPFDKAPLQKLVQDQLEMVRKGNMREAYDQTTSKGFRKATSFKEFVQFVHDQHMLLDSATPELNRLTFDNNVATLSGSFRGKDGVIYPAEYDFIQEGGEWKILHIEVGTPTAAKNSLAGSMRVKRFILGNEVDASGVVTKPMTAFTKNSGDIYLNLYLSDAKAGVQLEVGFENVDTMSSIPPVSLRIGEDGDANAMFIFSPPNNGWPVGHYRIHVKASTGLDDTYDFRVEGP